MFVHVVTVTDIQINVILKLENAWYVSDSLQFFLDTSSYWNWFWECGSYADFFWKLWTLAFDNFIEISLPHFFKMLVAVKLTFCIILIYIYRNAEEIQWVISVNNVYLVTMATLYMKIVEYVGALYLYLETSKWWHMKCSESCTWIACIYRWPESWIACNYQWPESWHLGPFLLNNFMRGWVAEWFQSTGLWITATLITYM